MTPDQFMREYETSCRTGGVEKTFLLIDDDAVYWFSDGSSHVGKRAIKRVLQQNAELIRDETYRISDIVWIVQTNDVAACVYRFDWSGILRGSPASGGGRGTSVLKRRGDSWVVVHEHLSKIAPEPE